MYRRPISFSFFILFFSCCNIVCIPVAVSTIETKPETMAHKLLCVFLPILLNFAFFLFIAFALLFFCHCFATKRIFHIAFNVQKKSYLPIALCHIHVGIECSKSIFKRMHAISFVDADKQTKMSNQVNFKLLIFQGES